MGRFKGVGPRMIERLVRLGYQREDGKPDVTRFCLDHRYDPRVFYEWMGDRRTPGKDLDRLSVDLGVEMKWLLFGDGAEVVESTRPKKPVSTAGGSAQVEPGGDGNSPQNQEDAGPRGRIMSSNRKPLARRQKRLTRAA